MMVVMILLLMSVLLVLQVLDTEAHPTDEGEGPGGQNGRHPAGAAGESTQGHRQCQLSVCQC